jgi:hypothetical protein
VTGGSGAFGHDAAKGLAAFGADVVVTSRRAENLEAAVETGFTQKTPGPSNIIFWIYHQVRWYILWSINAHGAEFEDAKKCLILSNALLLEEHRAFGVKLNTYGKHQKNRCANENKSTFPL